MTGSEKREEFPPRSTTNGTHPVKTPQIGPTLDRGVQAQIGDKLRAMYGELVEQPVPDRLAAILAQMGDRRRGGTNS